MSEEDQNIIRCFTQSPNVLLYGLPQLPIQDKWALLTLMGLCWDRSQTGKTLEELEGPYQLSLRQISGITGVDHTSLRSKQGKNPREGVLDRLERLGYLSVCEGKSIDEYTGEVLGHTQTYIYIHLRRIWDENSRFADEWRVPPNRLVREELVKLTVDHANSHVDDINSSVGKNNSNVDLDNDSVDGASTNYVLRQCNTKKIKEDREKILASDDATHTFSQEELHEKAIEFIRQKGMITFSDLEDFLSQYIDVEGKEQIANDRYKKAVAWYGISDQCCKLMIPILMDKRVETKPCSESLYKRKLKFPIATKLEDHENLHWHPEIISYRAAKSQGGIDFTSPTFYEDRRKNTVGI